MRTQPDKEIAGCINDIGIPFTAADLIKPNPQQIQMVMEWFAELLMNVTRETVDPAMRAAADDVGGDYPDIVPNETRNLMGFFISLRRLMMEVCMGFDVSGLLGAMTDAFVFLTSSAASTILRLRI